jgi:dihydroneopterin aldolase
VDLIFIEEMRVEALVGIFEREKVAPQTLEINLTFGVPDEAAQSDDIARTIRYDEVIERIRTELALRHFNLLETLGEYVIHLLLDEFRCALGQNQHCQAGHHERRAPCRCADRAQPKRAQPRQAGPSLAARVVLVMELLEPFASHMGVNLRRRNIGVA